MDERVGCVDMRRLPGDEGLAYRVSIAVRSVVWGSNEGYVGLRTHGYQIRSGQIVVEKGGKAVRGAD